ncbi:3-hydroxy-3-methylglutaryl-coenzyme A reductase 1-like [Camellia sinensis]|uniref:3-hydroxy-3-methylglutaryl-coenzyme A reductase 1-like n=1 Tax=Camellia sinensis TaxID=4442 RepID=UPI001036A0C0|nr:3-hydroxy-3-methylglutaryl-coenzyme A reductase 1-like [Camellia sinensis]
MDVRRIPPKPSLPENHQHHHRLHHKKSSSSLSSSSPKASDALPLPLYLTNGIFFTLFFSVAYYLLHRWRDKIRSSTTLHVVTLSELAAIASLIASFIYLLGFFGIGFIQSFITRVSHDAWDIDDDCFILEEDRRLLLCSSSAVVDCAVPPPVPKLMEPPPMLSNEEIVKSVVSGSIPSYSLEPKLGDCYRAASIRREAMQRLTGRSLVGRCGMYMKV